MVPWMAPSTAVFTVSVTGRKATTEPGPVCPATLRQELHGRQRAQGVVHEQGAPGARCGPPLPLGDHPGGEAGAGDVGRDARHVGASYDDEGLAPEGGLECPQREDVERLAVQQLEPQRGVSEQGQHAGHGRRLGRHRSSRGCGMRMPPAGAGGIRA